MKPPHQTIILTVIGHRLSLPSRLGGKRCVGLVHGMDGGESQARRALLRVWQGEDAAGLKRRLADSIARLTGGVAADAGAICEQIIDELERVPMVCGGYRGWTLAPVQDGAADDPYAPRRTRLTLIDSPVRRRRVTFRRRQAAFAGHEAPARPAAVTPTLCLS